MLAVTKSGGDRPFDRCRQDGWLRMTRATEPYGSRHYSKLARPPANALWRSDHQSRYELTRLCRLLDGIFTRRGIVYISGLISALEAMNHTTVRQCLLIEDDVVSKIRPHRHCGRCQRGLEMALSDSIGVEQQQPASSRKVRSTSSTRNCWSTSQYPAHPSPSPRRWTLCTRTVICSGHQRPRRGAPLRGGLFQVGITSTQRNVY